MSYIISAFNVILCIRQLLHFTFDCTYICFSQYLENYLWPNFSSEQVHTDN